MARWWWRAHILGFGFQIANKKEKIEKMEEEGTRRERRLRSFLIPKWHSQKDKLTGCGGMGSLERIHRQSTYFSRTKFDQFYLYLFALFLSFIINIETNFKLLTIKIFLFYFFIIYIYKIGLKGKKRGIGKFEPMIIALWSLTPQIDWTTP